jgi:hypothetical protein
MNFLGFFEKKFLEKSADLNSGLIIMKRTFYKINKLKTNFLKIKSMNIY